MKIKNSILLGVAALTIGFSFESISNEPQTANVSASSSFAYGRWVTLTKTTRVRTVKLGHPMSNSYTVGWHTLHRGHHIKIRESWVFGWVAESGRFNSGSRYAYVLCHQGKSWFRTGIH